MFSLKSKDIFDDIPEELLQEIWNDGSNTVTTYDLIKAAIYRSNQHIIKKIQEQSNEFEMYKLHWKHNKPASLYFAILGKPIQDGYMVKQFFDQRFWEFPLETSETTTSMKIIVIDNEKKETWFYRVKILGLNKKNKNIDFDDPAANYSIDLCKVEKAVKLFDAVIYIDRRYETLEGDKLRFHYEIVSNTYKKLERVGTIEDLINDLKNKGFLYEGFSSTYKQALLESIKQQLNYLTESYPFFKKIGVYDKKEIDGEESKLIVIYPLNENYEIVPESRAAREFLNKVRSNLRTYKDRLDFEEAIRILNKRLRHSTVDLAKTSTILAYSIAVPLARIVGSQIVPHMVLYGPKGTGKTTSARLFVNIYGLGIIETGTLSRSESTKHRLALCKDIPMMTDEVGDIDKVIPSLKEIATATEEHVHSRLTKEGEVRETVSITTPLVFTTNYPELFKKDQALMDRIIFISFLGEKTDPSFADKLGDAVKPIPLGYPILERIARDYLPDVLKEKYREIKKELESKLTLEARNLEIFALILLGKKLLTKLGVKVASEERILEVLKESSEFAKHSNEETIKDIVLEYCRKNYNNLIDSKEKHFILSNEDLNNILRDYRDLIGSIKGNKGPGLIFGDILRRCGIDAKYINTTITMANGGHKEGRLLKIPIPDDIKRDIFGTNKEKLKDELLEKVRELIKENSTIEIEELKAKLGTTRDLFDDVIQTLIKYGEIRIDGNKIKRCPI